MKLGDVISATTAKETVTGTYQGTGHVGGENISLIIEQGERLIDVYVDDLTELRTLGYSFEPTNPPKKGCIKYGT